MPDRLTYRWKKRPYHHQVRAVKTLLANDGGALLMEPRTGKTKVVIDYISILHQAKGVNRVLVIGPVSAIGVWKQQLEENCPFKYRLTIWDRKGRKQQELPSYGQDVLDIVLMNYDAFSTPGAWRVDRRTGQQITDSHGNKLRSKSRGGRYDMKKKITRWQPQVIVLDESHRIKSPSAKKSTALHSLKDLPDYKVIMTGTVVTKSKRLYDVWSQWKFLNEDRLEGQTFTEFKDRYSIMRQRENYSQWVGNKNEEELHELIHQDAFSITRDRKSVV